MSSFISCEELCLSFPSEPIISFRSFIGGLGRQKNNKQLTVLDRINLTCKPGDRVALVGANGSGKTTLLRILARIYHPTSGSFSSIGRVSTMFSLTSGMELELSGRENIYQKFSLMGFDSKFTKRHLDYVVDFSELEKFIDHPIRIYSSGMLMRLAFSVATVVECDILLMDEWLAVGDSSFSEKAQQKLNELIDRIEIFVIATHSQDLANNVCNKKLHLNNGKIVKTEIMSRDVAS